MEMYKGAEVLYGLLIPFDLTLKTSRSKNYTRYTGPVLRKALKEPILAVY